MLFYLLFFDYLENKRKTKTEVFFLAVTSPGGGNTSGKNYESLFKLLFNQGYVDASIPCAHLYS